MNLLKSIEEAKDVIATEKDEDFRDMAKAELDELMPAEKDMNEVLKEMLIPRDPNDSKDCILEVRGGTGGMKQVFLQVIYLECISDMLKRWAGLSKLWILQKARPVDIRR